MHELTGLSIIGYQRGAVTDITLHGINPATNEQLRPAYCGATLAEVDQAARLAEAAFLPYAHIPAPQRAEFLRQIAANIEALSEAITARANAETALPVPRLQGEIGRTCGALRQFADVIVEGSWVDARIDHAEPHRTPLPKPDVRSMLRPLGPVAVFGASNFPLAYSVAGGDTASALAAGCPVVVMAHYAHPGTAELVGQAIRDAAQTCALPEGVFSLLYGVGHEVGQALVQHTAITAVGFTGSRRGGLALMKLAQSRPVPIPFYGEMSSVNPVFVLPGALRERGAEIAAGLAASVTLGVGQFCTNPGLTILPQGAATADFGAQLQAQMAAVAPATMLTGGISAAYAQGLAERQQTDSVTTLLNAATDAPHQAAPSLARVEATTFLQQPVLAEEVFGPATLIVTHESRAEVLALARSLEGQLTATIHGTADDLHEWADLVAILETRAGRLIFNGFPTGVEVCPSMVHGGPFPATSDGRTTSVGTRALRRWTRLVCYQNWPASALPDELKDHNPRHIQRMVNGVP